MPRDHDEDSYRDLSRYAPGDAESDYDIDAIDADCVAAGLYYAGEIKVDGSPMDFWLPAGVDAATVLRPLGE